MQPWPETTNSIDTACGRDGLHLSASAKHKFNLTEIGHKHDGHRSLHVKAMAAVTELREHISPDPDPLQFAAGSLDNIIDQVLDVLPGMVGHVNATTRASRIIRYACDGFCKVSQF